MGMTFVYWFLKATTAQKIAIMICAIIFAAGAIIGVYQLTVGDIATPKMVAGADETKVVVQAIEDMKTEAYKLANTPAETVVNPTATAVESVPAQVVSNTVTVETPPQDYYIEDGAHYESAPVYEEPATVEPVYEEPVAEPSGGGDYFDGNLNSDYKWDTTGGADYGTGISN